MMNTVQMNGPDQILTDAADYISTEADKCVKLRIPTTNGKLSNDDDDMETRPPISVPGLLKKICQQFPDHVALGYKVNNEWKTITYGKYLELVRICAKAFLHLGLERHHAVCILGFNSPEWFISDLGAIFAGGIATGIYTTNSSEACLYCAKKSRANIIVVQDDKQLKKILEIRNKLPHLKAIIQYEGEPNTKDALSWEELINLGREQSDALLENVLKTVAINECCTLIYTSGTVGDPKAVMLNHDNLTWAAASIDQCLKLSKCKESVVSFLPLSHVAAQLIDIYTIMSIAGTVYFADPGALKGTLINTLKEVQPTRLLAVPRVWEKIYEKMKEIATKNGCLKKAIANWAKSHTLQHHLNKINGLDVDQSWSYTIASRLIFSKIKEALGLNRCLLNVSAAAPLATEIKRYFLSIDLPIMEGYGMSESSGPHTLSTPTTYNLETVGLTLPGMRTKLQDVKDDGEGEVCFYGRHVCMGYLGDREKTDEAIDPDGWLHTGDLGRIDQNGYVYVTGRSKELLITAGGENIAPTPIEQLVKEELPHISNAFLVGDRRRFLSILLTLKTEIEPENGQPLDDLLPATKEWIQSLGYPDAKHLSDVIDCKNNDIHPKLHDAIKSALDNVNTKAISNAQRIQKFAILPKDFSHHTGELGPTLKVKRNVVTEQYADIIDNLYV